MDEKVYKTLSNSGIIGIVVGTIAITAGVVTGVLMIVSGAKLLAERKDVII